MAELGTANIGGRAVPAWVLESTAEQVDNSKWFSRPNLLDNWYFVDPINQRGLTTLSNTVEQYFIDRWMARASSAANAWSLTADGLRCVCAEAATTLQVHSRQIIPPEVIRALRGQVVTGSVLYKATGAVAATGLYCWDYGKEFNATGAASGFTVTDGTWALAAFTGVLRADASENVSFMVKVRNAGQAGAADLTAKAAKLELGEHQTLAHQDASGTWVLNDPPPNKALELMKCQRYFQTFRTQALRPAYAADFRPVMRTEPATGTLTIDGVTYHTASADL